MQNPFLSFSLSRNTWIHLALTFSKNKTAVEGNFYVNGEFNGTRVKPCKGRRYINNKHVVYDVGRRRKDSQTTLKCHLKDLAVFGKVLTQGMISDVYREFATYSTIEAREICRHIFLFS